MQFLRPFNKILVNELALRMTAALKNVKNVNTNSYSTNKKFPDLLYFPHLLRWFNTKIKFKYLQNSWDPDFREGEFIYGTTHAICRITDIIHKNDPDRLEELLTKDAEMKLRQDMEYKLTAPQKEVISLKPEDIKLFVPIRVSLIRDLQNTRICKVLLKSLAMKWYEDKEAMKLVLIVLETEFRRDYSVGSKPEWFISVFDIVQCVLLGGNSATT